MLRKTLQYLCVLICIIKITKKKYFFVLRAISPQMHIYPAKIASQLLEMYKQQWHQ